MQKIETSVLEALKALETQRSEDFTKMKMGGESEQVFTIEKSF